MKMVKVYLVISWLMVFAYAPVFGQIKRYLADKEFNNFNYSYAINHYEKLAARKGVDYELVKHLADSYRLTGNSENAEKWYAKVVMYENSEADNLWYYAEALRNNGNYLEARNQFLLYGMKVPQNRKVAESYALACEHAMEWMQNAVQIKVENRADINTAYSEFSPAFYKNQLLFTTDRKIEGEEYTKKEIYGWTGNPYLYVMSASIIDSIQSFKINGKVSEIDNLYHNGPVSLSKHGDTLFFTRANKVRNPKKLVGKEKAVGFVNRLEIYYAVNKNGRWQDIKPFPYNNIKEYSLGHPALSQDGRLLYFASDMPGSMGETDIFYSEKRPDGSWSEPVNAGRRVNTIGKELFPYVANDGMLYFSSNGHQGMGGLDMYVAKGNKVDWKEVSNMKYPFNSPKDDFGIVLDSTGKSGFFSSNREGGKGGDDIYHFRNPTCVVAGLTLQMMDGSEKPLEDVMLTIYKKGDTASVIAYERSASTHAKKVCLRNYQPCATVYNAQGTFFLNLQPGVYEVKASKSGYFTQLATVEADCQGEDTIKLAMQLNPIILNKPIVLKDLFYDENDKLFVKKNIYYDLDKADIRYDAAMELDKLVEMLKNNPDIKIELSSHTDSRHTNEYNLSLAQRRAEAAVKYIVSKGISKDKIVAKGYGEEKLINHCKDGVSCSEEEHQQNRRTEIMVTEIIAPETHVVGPYDTLYTISRKYNISVDDLKDINDLSNEVIYAGDVIKLKK